MIAVSKELDCQRLVQQRKTCSLCSGLVNPSRCDQGRHDSNQIGPWSAWQGSLDAEFMIVGQDWGDTDYFTSNQGIDEQGNPTNNTLRELLQSIGVDIGLPHAHVESSRVFLTNAILCLKTAGGMQGVLSRSGLRIAGQTSYDR